MILDEEGEKLNIPDHLQWEKMFISIAMKIFKLYSKAHGCIGLRQA